MYAGKEQVDYPLVDFLVGNSGFQRPAFEYRQRTDVHVGALGFESKERRIESLEPVTHPSPAFRRPPHWNWDRPREVEPAPNLARPDHIRGGSAVLRVRQDPLLRRTVEISRAVGVRRNLENVGPLEIRARVPQADVESRSLPPVQSGHR